MSPNKPSDRGRLGEALVTGATGQVGGGVVRELLARGAPQVWTPIRAKDGRSAADRFAELQAGYAGDERLRLIETDEVGPAELPVSVRHVVHCAALVDFVTERRIVEANLLATWQLLCAAARAPALERVLHLGSLTIRTDTAEPFSEQHLDAGQSFVSPYTLTKFLAEVMIGKLHVSVPVTIVRAGCVLPDPGDVRSRDADWFLTTVRLWLRGRLTAIPMGADQPLYPVLARDLAVVLTDLLVARDVPTVLHIPPADGPPAERIFALLGERLGVAPPRLFSQSSSAWRAYRASLSGPVGRVVDSIYPPPPVGHRLAPIDSKSSLAWLEDQGAAMPEVPDSYWTALADVLASEREGGRSDE